MANGEDLQDDIAPESTVADDVRAAIEQHTSAVAEKLKEPVEASAEDDTETTAEKLERLRNKRGQFVAKDSAVETPKAAPAKPITDADRLSDPAQRPSTAVAPPTSWSADAKAEWNKLPAALQQAVVKRESEMSDGQRQWSERENVYRQALAPVQELSQQYQLPPNEVVNRLVLAEKRLQKEPVAAIQELMQAYGVSPQALVNGSQQPQRPAQQLDPNSLFQSLDQRLDARLQQWQAKQREDAETTQTINSFRDAKDEAGALKHPHFANPEIQHRMGVLLAAEEAKDISEAYDMAIWATPSVREALRAPAVVEDRQKKQVTKSKAAAISLKGAPNGAIKPAGNNGASVREDVMAAIAELSH